MYLQPVLPLWPLCHHVLLCLYRCCPAALGVPPSLMAAAPGPLHMLFLEVRFFATASVTAHPISVPCPLPTEPSPLCSWGSCTCFASCPSSLLASELREEGFPCRAACVALLPHTPCPCCSRSCGAEDGTDGSCFGVSLSCSQSGACFSLLARLSK